MPKTETQTNTADDKTTKDQQEKEAKAQQEKEAKEAKKQQAKEAKEAKEQQAKEDKEASEQHEKDLKPFLNDVEKEMSDEFPHRPAAPAFWKRLLHFINDNWFKEECEAYEQAAYRYNQGKKAFYKKVRETAEKKLEEKQKADVKEKEKDLEKLESKAPEKTEPEKTVEAPEVKTPEKPKVETPELDRKIAENLLKKNVNEAFKEGRMSARTAEALLDPENPRHTKQVDRLMKDEAFKTALGKVSPEKKERIANDPDFGPESQDFEKSYLGEKRKISKEIEQKKQLETKVKVAEEAKLEQGVVPYKPGEQQVANTGVKTDPTVVDERYLNPQLVNSSFDKYENMARNTFYQAAKAMQANKGLTAQDRDSVLLAAAGMVYSNAIRGKYNEYMAKNEFFDIRPYTDPENARKNIEKIANDPEFQKAVNKYMKSPKDLDNLARNPNTARLLGTGYQKQLELAQETKAIGMEQKVNDKQQAMTA